MTVNSQWQSASDEHWAGALAREAVIRLLTDQPEVTEELVVTASAEFGISRSLVYRLVAKFRTAAARFANRSGVLVLALFTDDHPRAPAKFLRIGAVYDLSTVFPRFKPMDRPPVHELSAVNGHSLRFKYRATLIDAIWRMQRRQPAQVSLFQ